ncbi:MAG: peroxidase-related enzyme [Pseudomonadota bacterium]
MTSFPVHTANSAPESSRDALAMIADKYGFVPNLAGVLAASPGSMKAFLGLMGAFDSSGMTLTALERQIVLLTASATNRCEYCAAAHGMLANMLGLDRGAVDAIQQGRPISDARLEALRGLTQALVEKRGRVAGAELDRFRAAGFTSSQVLEVVVGVALKTLTNYANHLAQPPINEQFAAFRPGWRMAA